MVIVKKGRKPVDFFGKNAMIYPDPLYPTGYDV